MKMNTMARRSLGAVLAGVMAFSGMVWVDSTRSVSAAETYYEAKESVDLGGGVTYETRKMVTSGGLLDVYILRVPLNDPYIELAPVFSEKEMNLKQGTAALVNEADAVAGVNGDFFLSEGKYGMPVGYTSDGERESASIFTNREKLAYATFLLDANNQPMITYLKTEVTFTHGGFVDMPIAYYNQLINFNNAVYIDTTVMANTAELDARDKGLMKLVVDNGVITRIVPKGETVAVPENGFLIVLSEKTYEFYKTNLAVGQTATVALKTSVNTDNINMAISGGGKILSNGQVVKDGYIATGRQPRTVIGVTQDGKQAILMVVDGRTHSIGATHEEVAALLLKEGAYNAMHLDGGGSSAMAVEQPGAENATIVNRLSEGSERAVANALAVLNNGPVGNVTAMVLKPAKEAASVFHGMPVDVYGVDRYGNRINIPMENLKFSASEGAVFENGVFTPMRNGVFAIQVNYGEIYTVIMVRGVSLASLKYTGETVSMGTGGQHRLSFEGTSRDGFAVSVDAVKVQYTVEPASLGVVENGVFRATGSGSGWIKCVADGAATYVPVSATGGAAQVYEKLDGQTKVTYTSWPNGIKGAVQYRTGPEVAAGDNYLEMTYTLAPSTATQAVYAYFGNALTTQADGFRISLYGTNSGHWIRGRVLDANGKEHLITFTEKADFTGWRQLDAMLPAGAKQPVTLERIYAASLRETAQKDYRLVVNDLCVLRNGGTVSAAASVPKDVVVRDDLRVDFTDTKPAADITFLGKLWYIGGSTMPGTYKADRKKAVAAFARGANAGVYTGAADLSAEAPGMKVRANTGTYASGKVGGATVITMNSAGGGFSIASLIQWARIEQDLKSAGSVVVVQTDNSPLAFKYAQEGNMFHALLKKHAPGRTIFVVSAAGLDTTVTVKEGIRYINLGHMYNGTTLNPSFSILRMRMENGTVKYGLEKVW